MEKIKKEPAKPYANVNSTRLYFGNASTCTYLNQRGVGGPTTLLLCAHYLGTLQRAVLPPIDIYIYIPSCICTNHIMKIKVLFILGNDAYKKVLCLSFSISTVWLYISLTKLAFKPSY